MRTTFQAVLNATRHRPWRVTEHGEIRCGESGACPLTAAALALAPEAFHVLGGSARPQWYVIAARVLGLTVKHWEVATAADVPSQDLQSPHKKVLRARMLKAYGLEEVGA